MCTNMTSLQITHDGQLTKYSAVCPRLSLRCTSAPERKSSSTDLKFPFKQATWSGDLPELGSRQFTIPPGIILNLSISSSLSAGLRQKFRHSMSSLAAAIWTRNGNKTASVVAASAAVHDQGAAAFCAPESTESDVTVI